MEETQYILMIILGAFLSEVFLTIHESVCSEFIFKTSCSECDNMFTTACNLKKLLRNLTNALDVVNCFPLTVHQEYTCRHTLLKKIVALNVVSSFLTKVL